MTIVWKDELSNLLPEESAHRIVRRRSDLLNLRADYDYDDDKDYDNVGSWLVGRGHRMTGAELVLRVAASRGVEVCFANPGTTEMALVTALDSVREIRPVLGLFEGVCTGMADGYARMAGKPSLTLLHLGVGYANGAANLHNARRAHSAIVNLVGDHPQGHLPYDAPLTSDIATLARPMSSWVHTARVAETLGDNVREAIARAGTRPGRIATLILPADLMEGNARASVTGRAHATAAISPNAEGGNLDEIISTLLRGDKVGMLLGGSALLAKEIATAGKIAAKTGARLFCEPFPGRMDRGAGLPELTRLPYFPEDVLARFEGLTHLVLVGARAPVSFFQYPGYPNSLVPKSCSVLTLCTPDQPAAHPLEALVKELGAGRARPVLNVAERREIPNGEITTKTLGAAIAAALPDGAIIADESATSGGPTYHLTRNAPRHSAMYLTGGGIGFGLPAATGAAVACPDRPVIALQGDGGGMYTPQALWTQAREGLNVTNVILVNRKYKVLQTEFERAAKGRPMGPVAADMTGLTRPEIDWCALARGMGVPAERPETAEALYHSLQRHFAEPGPALIEVLL
jgi:acetolactate synthase-1/2/3 large subunit